MDHNIIYKKLFITIKPYFVALIVAITGLICTKLIEGAAYKFGPKVFEESFIAKNIIIVLILSGAVLWGA